MNTDRGHAGSDQRAAAPPRGGARPQNLLRGELAISGYNRGLGSLFEPLRAWHLAWLRRRVVRSCVGNKRRRFFKGSESDAVAFVSASKHGK